MIHYDTKMITYSHYTVIGKIFLAVVFACALFIFTTIVYASDDKCITAVSVTSPVKLDGFLIEPAWETAVPGK